MKIELYLSIGQRCYHWLLGQNIKTSASYSIKHSMMCLCGREMVGKMERS